MENILKLLTQCLSHNATLMKNLFKKKYRTVQSMLLTQKKFNRVIKLTRKSKW